VSQCVRDQDLFPEFYNGSHKISSVSYAVSYTREKWRAPEKVRYIVKRRDN
jgi:hypothetical protein